MDAFTRAPGVFLQKSKQPKEPSDADAVFAPPGGDDRIHGTVTTTEPRGGDSG